MKAIFSLGSEVEHMSSQMCTCNSTHETDNVVDSVLESGVDDVHSVSGKLLHDVQRVALASVLREVYQRSEGFKNACVGGSVADNQMCSAFKQFRDKPVLALNSVSELDMNGTHPVLGKLLNDVQRAALVSVSYEINPKLEEFKNCVASVCDDQICSGFEQFRDKPVLALNNVSELDMNGIHPVLGELLDEIQGAAFVSVSDGVELNEYRDPVRISRVDLASISHGVHLSDDPALGLRKVVNMMTYLDQLNDKEFMLEVHRLVVAYGLPNYRRCPA